ncbi:hypothetical protein ACIRYZ_43485 [Kitasatospora sp. NPDC101155]|uniref:hypothetical protein n=1 Tax=Kitasatospora sp. NPDC101155 TaxID=3364097 RepID=UPI0038110163
MDDDAAHRRGNAEEVLRAHEEARLLQEHRDEQSKLAEARQKLRGAERTAAQCRRLSRVRALGGTGAAAALLGGLGWEEEAYALALGVGAYQEFGSNEEDLALARFTQRVEDLRNKQRRRQQQLDQPAEQTGHHQQAQA